MRLLQCVTLFILAISFFALGDTKNLRKRSGSIEIEASSGNSRHSDSAESSTSSLGSEDNNSGGSSTTENLIDKGIDETLDITENIMNDTEEVTFGILDDIVHVLEMIPIVGTVADKMMSEMKKGYRGFGKFTNGFIGRVLGGSLPCTITLKNGTVCQPVKKNDGMSAVIIHAMEEIPLMPSIVIKMMNATMGAVFDPMADVVVGGVSE